MQTAELLEYQRQIESIRKEFRNLVSALSEVQYTWHPASGAWSVAECIEHLNLFGAQVEENVTAMITEARSKSLRAPGPYRRNWLADLLLRSVEPPYKLKFRAVSRLQPTRPAPKEITTQEFEHLQDRLEALLKEADGLDLGAVRRPVPPTNLRFTLSQWLALSLAHERRHLWQAQQVLSHPAFPPPPSANIEGHPSIR